MLKYIIPSVIVLFLLVLLGPQIVIFHVQNQKGHDLSFDLQLNQKNYSNPSFVFLWRGNNTVNISVKGYVDKEFQIDFKYFAINPVYTREFVLMKPLFFDLSMYNFTDPTGVLDLSPSFSYSGVNILNESVEDTSDRIMFGNYSVTATTELFSAGPQFVEGSFSNKLLLPRPDKNHLFTESQVSHMLNFFEDYKDLFQALPKQYFFYPEKIVVSLGDMLLLYYEHILEEDSPEPVYYLPIGQTYSDVNLDANLSDTFRLLVDGKVSAFVEKSENLNLSELNQRKDIPTAFSYDIEAGRYFHEKTGLDPCFFDINSGYKDICSDPKYFAWYTPLQAHNSFNISYPFVSLINGYQEILDYTIRYGVPTTQYWVDRDYHVMEFYAPELLNKTKNHLDFIEIGTHSRYHTYLGLIIPEKDLIEINSSKNFLEHHFNTTVVGMRSPYLTLIGNSKVIHGKAMDKIGLDYFSNDGERVPEYLTYVQDKPVNVYIMSHQDPELLLQYLRWQPHLITLDHPWNFYYEETGEPVHLIENRSRAESARKNLLFMISEGAVPVKVKEIKY